MPSDYGKDCIADSDCQENFCDSFIGRKCSRRCFSDAECQKTDASYYCRDDGRCAPSEFVTRWKPLESITIDGVEYKNAVVFPYGNGHCNYTIHYSDGATETYPKCPAFSTSSESKQGHIHSFKELESDGLVTIKVTGKIENWTCGIAANIEPSHLVEGVTCGNACKVYVGDLGNCGSKSYCSLDVTEKCKAEVKVNPQVHSLCENLVSVESFGPVKLAPFTFYNAISLQKISAVDIPDSTNLTSLMFSFYHTDSLDNANIELWDTSKVTTMRGAFFRAKKFNTSLDNWDTSKVTDMKWAFTYASSFNQPLNHWNTSNVTDMQCMFSNAKAFNQPLNNWYTGNVTDMTYMFQNAQAFNSDISTWNTSKLTALTSMFASTKFNKPIGDWDVSHVTSATRLFWGNSSFNQNLNKWNVSKMKDTQYMFYGCITYNQPMNDWNVSNVTNMESMFDTAKFFNQPLDKWDTSKVKNMRFMFRHTFKFNQDISGWKTPNLEILGGIFYDAKVFNKDISNWNTSKVTLLGDVFYQAEKFNQDLSKWDVSKVDITKKDGITGQRLFKGSNISKENYCKLYKIAAWKNVIDKANETKLYTCD